MTCRDVAGYLREHVAAELDAEDRAEFDGHRQACDNCREFVREYVAAIEAARAAFGAAPDAQSALDDAFVASVLADVAAAKGGA